MSNGRRGEPHSIRHLAEAVRKFYSCEATWIATVPAHEEWFGDFATEGVVQVYELTGHDRAKRCYVWNYKEGGQWYYTTVLAIPPVKNPESAVRAGMRRCRRRTIQL
jgi:hypothetical protein